MMGRFCPLNRQDNCWGERDKKGEGGERGGGGETENMRSTPCPLLKKTELTLEVMACVSSTTAS